VARLHTCRRSVPPAEFRNCDFEDAHFSNCTIAGAKFIYCTGLWGPRAGNSEGYGNEPHGIERAIFSEEPLPYGWQHIRVLGSLHLFGISWFAVIAVSLYATLLHWYNQQICKLQHASDTVPIVQFLHPLQSSRWLTMLLISCGLLGIASAIYDRGVPEHIKEFTRLRWTHELGKSEMAYIAASYTHPNWRAACALLYLAGGSLTGLYILHKFVLAFIWLWEAL
jgi:hypothetical protein